MTNQYDPAEAWLHSDIDGETVGSKSMRRRLRYAAKYSIFF
jgi:hypothetical protein